MGYELGRKVLREASLVRELQASEAALRERERQMRQVIRESQQLSRRLIDAQEDERRRIARELHDDHSQRLAVVALDLSALQHHAGDGAADPRVVRALSEVQSLSSDLHALSYRLHPAKLDQLGLVSTARGWCRDLSATSGVSITFQADGLPDDVRGRAGVSLFRVLQEATRNVVRHSRATAAQVRLFRAADGIHLVVEDNGCGFNVDEESRTRGLGLLSMEERARLLGGRLSVAAREGGGMRVEAIVPVDDGEAFVDAARHQE
jgi:signal transduction histidine kinase